MSKKTGESVVEQEVLIVGAGPVGLSLANLLGLQGVSVTVLDALTHLIDYPRAVGIDDESLRSVQTMGLIEQVLPYTTPQHVMRLVNGKGKQITEIRPTTDEFGWSRRNAFGQPEVDRVLLDGLERFEHVRVLFGHDVETFSQDATSVTVTGTASNGKPFTMSSQYLVGADGGRSKTRKHMGVSFEGQSPSTRWLVVDMGDDPLGTPNIYLGADPARPYVSLGLPQGVRRFEFMLFDHEPDSIVENTGFVESLLAAHVPDPTSLDIVRSRVYTHHSRIAGDFRQGRIFIAGDAAHLMPVWQGQGWNSGERDATNLAWKLAAVITGQCDDRLLDSYRAERHAHAKAMIDLSTAFGRVVKPTNRLVAGLRDAAAAALNAVPQIRDYFALMKYKPMPRYEAGVVVDASTLTPGRSSAKIVGGLHAHLSATTAASPVGTQFIQPLVTTADGSEQLLDDVIGYRWAVLEWGGNPERQLTESQRETLRQLGAVLISARPVVQCSLDLPQDPDAIVVGDVTGRLKAWFDDRPVSTLVLRPDRFIASATLSQQSSAAVEAVARATCLRADAKRASDAAQPVSAAPAN